MMEKSIRKSTNLPLFVVQSTDSTNSTAKKILHDSPSLPGVVVIAQEQFQGRGRLGKVWESSSCENVFFSYAMRYHSPVSATFIASLQVRAALAALALVRNSVEDAQSKKMFLKYPNDVVYFSPDLNLRKLAGILVENEFLGSACSLSVIGIGINLLQTSFPEHLTTKAISLKQIETSFFSTPIAFAQKLQRYTEDYLSQDQETIFEQWKKELRLEGEKVYVVGKSTPYSVANYGEDFRLVLRSPEGETITIDDGTSLQYLRRSL